MLIKKQKNTGVVTAGSTYILLIQVKVFPVQEEVATLIKFKMND